MNNIHLFSSKTTVVKSRFFCLRTRLYTNSFSVTLEAPLILFSSPGKPTAIPFHSRNPKLFPHPFSHSWNTPPLPLPPLKPQISLLHDQNFKNSPHHPSKNSTLRTLPHFYSLFSIPTEICNENWEWVQTQYHGSETMPMSSSVEKKIPESHNPCWNSSIFQHTTMVQNNHGY